MSIRSRVSFLSLALTLCPPLAVRAQPPACSTGTVPTSSGPVCGIASRAPGPGGAFTASAYLGIPYAVPPVGPRRWQYSTLFQGSELLHATAYGPSCPQSLALQPSRASSSQCADGRSLGLGESEDCLYLNVWAPSGATASSRLPVMVFIPGGAFYQGSGGPVLSPSGAPLGNLYDGTYLAAAGQVIVVTFNYRLGVLGFLAHGGNHNFGFADQIVALQWVRANIANFGGDPGNVTLFGQSAGAKSVGLHALSSPRSAGLFQAAIMESNALGLAYKSISQAEELRGKFCACGSLCETATAACDLIAAQNDYMAKQRLSFATISNFLWTPTVDDAYITGQPISSAANLGVPLLLGTNRDEGTVFVFQAEDLAPKSLAQNPPGPTAYERILEQQFGTDNVRKILGLPRYQCGTSSDCSQQLAYVMTDFAFTCANRHLALQATRGAAPQTLYLYQFTQVTNFNLWQNAPDPVCQCQGLVCHTDEVPYVFNSIWQFGTRVAFTREEETLAQAIGDSWTSFARDRNPGVAWPLFKPGSTYRLLNVSSSTANDPLDAAAHCSTLWDGIGYGKTRR